jgi:hypothetical protein
MTYHAEVIKPNKEYLERYYELWLTCESDADLLMKLSQSFPAQRNMQAYVKRHLPAFHSFCRHKLSLTTKASLVSDGTVAYILLNDERRSQLLTYAGLGYPLEKCAAMLNVPLLTITELWFKVDPELKEELVVMRDRYDARVLNAIFKRAEGYELTDEQVTTEEAEHLTKDGQVVKVKTTRILSRVNHVPGATQAQKLWAANRLGWTDNPTVTSGDEERTEFDVRDELYHEGDEA